MTIIMDQVRGKRRRGKEEEEMRRMRRRRRTSALRPFVLPECRIKVSSLLKISAFVTFYTAYSKDSNTVQFVLQAK